MVSYKTFDYCSCGHSTFDHIKAVKSDLRLEYGPMDALDDRKVKNRCRASGCKCPVFTFEGNYPPPGVWAGIKTFLNIK